MEKNNDKKYAIKVFYNNMMPLEQIMYIGGYVHKAVGVSAGLMTAIASINNPDVSAEKVLFALGFGAAFYTIGNVIHSNQSKLQTYKKLDNIEKLLIEQNKTIKGD